MSDERDGFIAGVVVWAGLAGLAYISNPEGVTYLIIEMVEQFNWMMNMMIDTLIGPPPSIDGEPTSMADVSAAEMVGSSLYMAFVHFGMMAVMVFMSLIPFWLFGVLPTVVGGGKSEEWTSPADAVRDRFKNDEFATMEEFEDRLDLAMQIEDAFEELEESEK